MPKSVFLCGEGKCLKLGGEFEGKKKYGVYEKSENGVRKSVLDLVCDGLPDVISASAWPA